MSSSTGISMYGASVPVFQRALRNLDGVLAKAEAFAADKGIEPQVLLRARLRPDMLDFVRQVQIACDMAKNGTARLAGVDPMPIADDETTFEQLHARIARTLDYIGGFDAAKLDGSEQREVRLTTRTAGELVFTGQDYLLHFVLPNLFFHSSIAYALLRDAGVELGKSDFIGAPKQKS